MGRHLRLRRNEATDDVVARGIRYAADNGAKIINMSIGRTGDRPAPVVEDAIKYAVGKGVFIADRRAATTSRTATRREVVAEIASRVQGAVSVAAVDPDKSARVLLEHRQLGRARGAGRHRSRLRPRRLRLAADLDFKLHRHLSAAAGAVHGAALRRRSATSATSGTSQATPHVSGVAAMLMQQGITDPAAIEAALERFATDLGDPGRDNTFGFGLIEARDTLRGLGLAK